VAGEGGAGRAYQAQSLDLGRSLSGHGHTFERRIAMMKKLTLAVAILGLGAATIYGNASKLVGYATQLDGSFNEVTSVKIRYNSPQGLAGF
jgi:hypothetical protein